jgi:hypothetical protein
MKNTTFVLLLSSFIPYSAAANENIWHKARTDQVPEALLGKERLGAPESPYGGVFPKSFLQNSMYVVCYQQCQTKDIFRVENGEIKTKDQDNMDVIEQSNVYYWLTQYFSFLDEKLTFNPKYFLKVMTDRQLTDETKGKKLNNNAFFNPLDVTLSFLPAKNNLLFKLLSGKLNRSGFDPSVITHEASHYLFHHLFPNPINSEIGGLNEGFADYMANIFLNEPKLGLVMMHGRVLRDSSNPLTEGKNPKQKVYEPKMEVHDLGERVSYALWSSRLLSDHKEELDRLVIDAVKDLGRNPYSTVHDFKVKMLERLPHVIPSQKMAEVTKIWEETFPGSVIKLVSTDFLNKPRNVQSFLGFYTKQVLPAELAKEYGAPEVEESNFTILKVEVLSETQKAILISTEDASLSTPYWVVVDSERNNVLAIYDLENKLVTNAKELTKVAHLAEMAKSAGAFMKEFLSDIKSLSSLSNGEGTLNLIYKVKSQETTDELIHINGLLTLGQKTEMKLRRRLVANVLGAPEMSLIELYTLPLADTELLPKHRDQYVVGYRKVLKTGTEIKVLLNKFKVK